jgi:hypothetical protein
MAGLDVGIDRVRTDEPGATGNEDVHLLIL